MTHRIDLRRLLNFSPEEGILRVGSQRSLFISADAFSILRDLMYDQLGSNMARTLLMKFGYQHGAQDFRTLSQLHQWQSDEELLAAGPEMHAWSGVVKVEPRKLKFDRTKGHFHFHGIWRNSYEAEMHLKRFGRSSEPVCLTLCGYGSGWCSAFFGGQLLEIETRCVAMGDPHCEWEIKPIEEWGPEADKWKKSLLSAERSIYRRLEEASANLKNLNSELEGEVDRRIEDNRNLLRVLCHDLTTPLSVLKSDVQNLRKKAQTTENPAGLEESFGRLEATAATMEEILSHVRDAQAHRTGKKSFTLAPVEVEGAVEKARLTFSHSSEKKGITLRFENSLPPGVGIEADEAVFSNHILSNVLSNAIKFAPEEGNVTIRATLEGERVCLTVEDDGIGIPQHILERMFDKKAATHRMGTAGESGTGFGMPLVKYYVESLGGSLAVESWPVQDYPETPGTAFHLYFHQRSLTQSPSTHAGQTYGPTGA